MFKKVLVVLLVFVCFGCASHRDVGVVPAPYDPIEQTNRGIFAFNEVVNDYVYSPVIDTYNFILPEFLRTRVYRFFSNIGEMGTVINSLLQAKFENAGVTTGRFAINSTVGVAGLFDVATDWGVTRDKENFSKTLTTWGVAEGPIITVPFLYPMSIRHGIGMIGDIFLDPMYFIVPAATNGNRTIYWVYYGASIFVFYADNLEYLEDVKNVTLDPYSAIIRYTRLSEYADVDGLPMSAMSLHEEGESQATSVSYDFDFDDLDARDMSKTVNKKSGDVSK